MSKKKDSSNVYLTYNEKGVSTDGLDNYIDKVISGDSEFNCVKQEPVESSNTFEYDLKNHKFGGKKQEETFDSELNFNRLSYKFLHASSKQAAEPLGKQIKETPVIIDMKKAVKRSKRGHEKHKSQANRRIMNFDFQADSNANQSADLKEEESNENIIVDGFTLNEDSPTTLNSKVVTFKNYDYFDSNKHRSSQNS